MGGLRELGRFSGVVRLLTKGPPALAVKTISNETMKHMGSFVLREVDIHRRLLGKSVVNDLISVYQDPEQQSGSSCGLA